MANRLASPNPAAITNDIKPTETPQICGRLARNPKFAPEAASIMLLGPGVKAETVANSVNDRMVGKSIGVIDLIFDSDEVLLLS